MSIRVEHISYIYGKGSPFEKTALDDVDLTIEKGEFIGIIGHTGSGKSTLIQHLNGLIHPTCGKVTIDGVDLAEKSKAAVAKRHSVGMVFQYPEHQLFETEVLTDVCFGPKNLGFTKEEAEEKAKAALRMVGMGEEYDKSSPFELSGGQNRRVAIAGVLAMDPVVLILDEPTAGLDPRGRDEVLDQVSALQRSRGITVILVSHSMEDVAKYVDRLIVMNQGEVRFDGRPVDVFHHYKELEEIGLAAPQTTYLMQELKKQGADVNTDATTVEEAADAIEAWLKASK